MTGKIKVLIVEDEELLLDSVVRKLNNLGYETVSCPDAKKALDYLNRTPNLPDVIWLDYYLPDINGEEFVKTLSSDERYSKIPIVVVSNSASDEKRKTMSELGVKKYFLKAENRIEDIADSLKDLI